MGRVSRHSALLLFLLATAIAMAYFGQILSSLALGRNMFNPQMNTPISPVILYPREPQRFVSTLMQCLQDPKCHFLYHHVKKTAGFFIAGLLYPVFENGDHYVSRKWCCDDKLMKDFWNRSSHYCVEQKMSILEVFGDDFEKALQTCEETYGNEGHRYVALVSLREPIQRTLSQIHQNCNKNLGKRSDEYQSFCRNCTYGDHSADFWHRFVNDTNRSYQTVYEYIQRRKVGRTSETVILVIDTSMVDNFLLQFGEGLVDKSMRKGTYRNEEKLDNCNFGMTSRMLKLLRPSNEIFLNIWSGHNA